MYLLISYHEPPFGWLERVKSDRDLYEMYAPGTTNIVHNSSQNSLVVEGRWFWYADAAWGLHTPPEAYRERNGWFRYDLMSGTRAQEERLVNWLFRLGWQAAYCDADLYPYFRVTKNPRKRRLPLGILSRITLEHLGCYSAS